MSNASSIVRITSSASLQDFVERLQEYSHLGPLVTDLTVALNEQVHADTLRACLLATPHLEDLILTLPSDTPGDILEGVQLSRLELFSTTLPHHRISDFLASHGSLTNLCLGPCWRILGEPCSLSMLDLGHVITLECPIDCVGAATHSGLRRLTIEEHGHSQLNAPAVLRSIRTPLTSIFALTLDISPDDYDILDKVARAAPNVQKLKLLEKPRSYRRQNQLRRAWNDAKSWSQSLSKFNSLEEFALRTASTLMLYPATFSSEKRTLLKWTTRTARAVTSTNKRAIGHPTLTCLRVWYRCREPTGGVSTCWSKYHGTWENIFRTTDVLPDTPF